MLHRSRHFEIATLFNTGYPKKFYFILSSAFTEYCFFVGFKSDYLITKRCPSTYRIVFKLDILSKHGTNFVPIL